MFKLQIAQWQLQHWVDQRDNIWAFTTDDLHEHLSDYDNTSKYLSRHL
jgi:hypothetical protein